MIVAVDAMGGDYAPQATVQGSIDALNNSNNKLEIILLGDENQINDNLQSQYSNNFMTTLYDNTVLSKYV